MIQEEKVYKDLQRHLDKQPVGYPATKSGADIRLLRRFFEPEEAELAMKLSYKPKTAQEIFDGIKQSGISLKQMEEMLEGMLKKGVIGHMEREKARYFFNVPLVVGMYEGQLNKLTPEFLADFDEYTRDRAFGLEFLATALPQMRTIPVARSITPEHHVATYDQLTRLLMESDGPTVVNECICRQAAKIRGKECRKTTRMETCMALGDIAKNCIRVGLGRQVSKEEALAIARSNEEEGLVLQPSNAQEAEFLCACCGCCCGMLAVHKALPRPVAFWATNYHASVDPDECTGCGTCEERCQVDAIKVDDTEGISKVNLDRCIGCGNCVTTCPSEAVHLEKKEEEARPPETNEDLYDIIMANKKGKLGKLKLAARLILKK
ncbi:MAG: 4Fe-4S binding protein [Proteobacteria bacterium]|nr:4Fe-4S binding protein [Pseudomonadota bacterium]